MISHTQWTWWWYERPPEAAFWRVRSWMLIECTLHYLLTRVQSSRVKAGRSLCCYGLSENGCFIKGRNAMLTSLFNKNHHETVLVNNWNSPKLLTGHAETQFRQQMFATCNRMWVAWQVGTLGRACKMRRGASSSATFQNTHEPEPRVHRIKWLENYR